MITGKYAIDKSLVLQKAYYLLCIFFADKEISRRSDPDDEQAPLKSLERRFFETEASRLLLEVAISIRVIDDQMKQLPESDTQKQSYINQKKQIDKYPYGLFDDLNLDLRETCNKIIHSDVMEPHNSEGSEANEHDPAHKYGEDEKRVHWEHLNGYVRLAGTKQKNPWYVLLDIEMFVIGVCELLDSI